MGGDWDKLDQELAEIQNLTTDIDMRDFGFSVTDEGADLDNFFDESGNAEASEKKVKTVTCPHCGETFEI